MPFSILKKITATLGVLAILTGSFILPIVNAAPGDIVDVTVSSAPEFSTLVTALTAADLISVLQGPGPFTVVAPTNAAFAALPADVLAKLLLPVNKVELQKILKYHVVSGSFNSTTLTTLAGTLTPTAATVEGSNLTFTIVGGALKINTNTTAPVVASVVTPDVTATNGIIHAIDTVLLPASFNPATLQSAPTSNIIGISHGTVNITPSSKATASKNIVQTAIDAPAFSTLVATLKAAGLVDTLSGNGPFTVLAPTNDAFAKIPADVLEKLLLPENKQALVKVLTYHVVSGKVKANQIVKLDSATTVQGSDIKIAVVDGKVKINGNTTVITTDIEASNGVIHSIDSVLLPSDLDLSKLVSKTASVMTKDVVNSNVVESHGKGTLTRTGGAD